MNRLLITLFFIFSISFSQTNYDNCINSYIYTLNGDKYGCWTSLHEDWCKYWDIDGEWLSSPYTVLMFNTFEECCKEASSGWNSYDESNCNCPEIKEREFKNQDWITDIEDSWGKVYFREIDIKPYIIVEFESNKYQYYRDYTK
jgi:hypothetical protein